MSNPIYNPDRPSFCEMDFGQHCFLNAINLGKVIFPDVETRQPVCSLSSDKFIDDVSFEFHGVFGVLESILNDVVICPRTSAVFVNLVLRASFLLDVDAHNL